MSDAEMVEYLQSKFDLNSKDFVSAIDELTLWSAPFGLMLLEHVELRKGIKVLDIGCGLGFPAIEFAQRLGDASVVYGIDPWSRAIERGRHKITNHQVGNVQLIEGDAAATGFENGFFDLIISNLGINNFENPQAAVAECNRVLKESGQIVLTTNFKGHMQEFYNVFQQTLEELGMNDCSEALNENIDHRMNLETIVSLLEETGFEVNKTITDSFRMRFMDGSAFLRHYFIRLGFLEGWTDIVPRDSRVAFFGKLEQNLNRLAEQQGELALTIPMGYIEGRKIDQFPHC